VTLVAEEVAAEEEVATIPPPFAFSAPAAEAGAGVSPAWGGGVVAWWREKWTEADAQAQCE